MIHDHENATETPHQTGASTGQQRKESVRRRIIVTVLVSSIFCFDQMLCTVIIPILHHELCLTEGDNRKYGTVASNHNTTFSYARYNANSSQTPSDFNSNNSIMIMTKLNETTESCSEDNVKLKSAFLVGFKGLVQILVNPMIGKLIDALFPAVMLIAGIIANVISTILYAFGQDFTTIITARAINGLGAACIGSGGLAIIADTFHRATERNRQIGIVNFFLFAGNAIGPTYGGIIYDIMERKKQFVFLLYLPLFLVTGLLIIPIWKMPESNKDSVLSGEKDDKNSVGSANNEGIQENKGMPEVAIENGNTACREMSSIPSEAILGSKACDEDNDNEVLLSVVINTSCVASQKLQKPTPMWKLLMDPYILICAVGLVVANLSHNCLAATIGIWMDFRFEVTESEKGLVWLPTLIFHFTGTVLTVWLCSRYPSRRYIFVMIGLIIGGISSLLMPFMPTKAFITIPIGLTFFTIAVVDVTVLPMLNHLVDVRHTSVYGSVSAIAYIAFSTSSAIGCFASGPIFMHLGFTWLNIILFSVCLLYAPIFFVMKTYCPK